MAAVAPETLASAPDGEPSPVVAARVAQAHATALARQGCANARLQGDALDTHCALDAAASAFLQAASSRLALSARSHHRVLRVARTIADLAGARRLAIPHLAEAVQTRRAMG